MHQRYHPGFAADIPYNVTIVELEEGPRLPTNLVGIANSDIRVGLPVQVEWERHSDVALPKFRPGRVMKVPDGGADRAALNSYD
jgi:uncharacterized OB-fold protein